MFISVKEAIKKGSGEVKLRGWCYRARGSNALRFIILRDATDIIQCVVEKDKVSEESWDDAQKIDVEASFELSGEIVEDKRAPTGYEVKVKEIKLIGESIGWPIQKDQSTELLADLKHLWLRSRYMTSILKIRSTVFGAIHEYFRSKGFYEFQSPIFQATQAEGGSTLFSVNYFGKPVYLAQTWQLYAEPAIFALEKIYTIAPSFRAEKSKTSRHLTEYWHAEMEVAWATFKDIQDYGEELIKHVIKRVLEKNQEELKILNRDTKILEKVRDEPFIRMTYTDALKELKEKCNIDIEWGKDLRTIEEDELSKLHNQFLIVTNYPKEVKAFYMKEDDTDPKVVHGCDFIAPECYGEIIGGSERESDLEKIRTRLLDQGEDPEKYTFYLDTRRYGSVPHGGFGMGVERLISFICHLENIKDAIPFPRTMLRTTP
ncbi:MAG: asparagine--tRNA ligase [Candidatus Woesearchaeota archaeon]|nr:MAG: asparagine--tRNA ligase [Candidatus Woesearchaeota archaeon]